MKIFFFIIFILWLIKVSRDILFWVYLWQLKEYRLDRMRAHFELQSAQNIFRNKIYIGKIAMLVSSVFLFWGVWQFFFHIIVSTFYVIFGSRNIYSAYLRKIREPDFTKKAILLCAISVIFVTFVGFFVYQTASTSRLLFSLLLIDILIPVIVAITVGILKLPSEFFKKRIIARAKEKREQFKDVVVIGITGSYGKTSMKEFLAHMLSKNLRVLKTEDNQNSEIGVAKCVLDKLNGDYDVFIVEMGAYKSGEIKKICDIVHPQIGILTGINEQHVSLFGSLPQTIKAKYELIKALPKNGLAIFNGENEYTFALYERTTIPKRMYSLRGFSVSARPDITAEKIDFLDTLSQDLANARYGMEFYVKLNEDKGVFETNLLGKHNVLNILGAALGAMALGMNLDEIKNRVKTLKAPEHTLQLKPGLNGSRVIDDSYSANPRGVMAALDILHILKGKKKILILYPLIELGESASDAHRRIGARINKVCDVCILVGTDFAREIRNNAPNTDVFIMQSPKIAIARLKKIIKQDDIVLLENRIPEEIKNALLSL